MIYVKNIIRIFRFVKKIKNTTAQMKKDILTTNTVYLTLRVPYLAMRNKEKRFMVYKNNKSF